MSISTNLAHHEYVSDRGGYGSRGRGRNHHGQGRDRSRGISSNSRPNFQHCMKLQCCDLVLAQI